MCICVRGLSVIPLSWSEEYNYVYMWSVLQILGSPAPVHSWQCAGAFMPSCSEISLWVYQTLIRQRGDTRGGHSRVCTAAALLALGPLALRGEAPCSCSAQLLPPLLLAPHGGGTL